MGKVPLPGTLSLSICSEQKRLEFLLPSLKMLIQENKLFWQKLMAYERPFGKCLGAAKKALLLRRDTKKGERWTHGPAAAAAVSAWPVSPIRKGVFHFLLAS